MATAPLSYGYPKSAIDAAHLPVWMQPLSRFSVAGPSDWEVTRLASIDRGLNVAPGEGSGDGVTDFFAESDTVRLPYPSMASQWYLIVRRRNWAGFGTTNTVAIPGTSERTLPIRADQPGVESDHPLALARVTQKDTTVQDLIDLRVWANNGGVEAKDRLVLDFLNTPGSAVKIGSSLLRYEHSGMNVWSWAEDTYDSGHIAVGAAGSRFGAGWEGVIGGGYNALGYRVIGKQVQVFGAARATLNQGPASVVAHMPVGLRPWRKVPGVRCEMNADGALRAEAPWADGATPSFFCTYFVA